MRRFSVCLALLATFSHLSAQETGEAAVASSQEAIENNWQNWTFFAITIFVAAGAVYAVSVDSGRSAD